MIIDDPKSQWLSLSTCTLIVQFFTLSNHQKNGRHFRYNFDFYTFKNYTFEIVGVDRH